MVQRNETEIFKGFIRFLTDLKMRIRMFVHLTLIILILQLFFNIFNFILLKSVYENSKILYFESLFAIVLSKVPFINGIKFFTVKQHELSAIQFSYVYSKLVTYYNQLLYTGFKNSFYLWPLLPFSYIFFWFKSRNVLKEKHIRGAILLNDKAYSKKIKNSKNDIELNNQISIPFNCENRHVFTIGRPGAGKTQLLCKAIEKVVSRNEKAIIYDFKGDFVTRFYNPNTDIIFNPLDERSVGWCIFNEIKSATNIEAICSSLIPAATKSEPFWDNAARDVLYSVLLYCWKNNIISNSGLFDVSISNREILLEKFSKTPGCERGVRPLEEAKVGASVLSTFSTYVKFLEYTKDMAGEFSIKNWVIDNGQKGRIFITNYSEIGTVMQPLIALFIDVFANKVLMLPENIERRIFFFLDEFGTLQRLSNILNMLKLSRSYGGSIWIGIQDIGQIENVYGRESTKTIMNSCGNAIIFGVDEPLTADYLSKKVGERERSNIDKNFSFGLSEFRDGHSMSERTMVEKTILPSDIMGLDDLSFYFKLATLREFTKSKLEYKKYPIKAVSFIDKKPPPFDIKNSDSMNIHNNTEHSRIDP
ncbi:MAG: type IV secretion system DNA-binding domain-containing protein [Oligoflexia bacterium]|nr:type IV secretion system DNA-binding domain-containing protein [Oligoflexia bacterium]